jgi:hypothetical protein
MVIDSNYQSFYVNFIQGGRKMNIISTAKSINYAVF